MLLLENYSTFGDTLDSMIFNIILGVMVIFYFLAGANHFINPAIYLKMMPPCLQRPKFFNLLSGAAEILLAILVAIPATRAIGAWGIIALLIAVFPANIEMLRQGTKTFKLPTWVLVLRLPLQLALIFWAYMYT